MLEMCRGALSTLTSLTDACCPLRYLDIYAGILPAWVAAGCQRYRHPPSRCSLLVWCCFLTLAAAAAASAGPGGTTGDPPLIVSLPTRIIHHYRAH